MLDLIGDDADVLGVALDTGWWATQGYDPVQAIRDLPTVSSTSISRTSTMSATHT